MGDTQIHVLKPDVAFQRDDSMQPHADAVTQKIYADAYSANVKIDTPTGSGSGFFFDKNGDIATDAHVVIGDSEIYVTLADGKRLPARVTKMDDLRDVAVLQIDGGTPADVKPLTLNNDGGLVQDQPLWALGHPQGESPLYISPGYYRGDSTAAKVLKQEGVDAAHAIDEKGMTPAEAEDENHALARRLWDTGMHVEPGNSGGPVLNAKGEVVGLADLGDQHRMAMVTPIEDLKALMESTNPLWKFDYKWSDKSSGATGSQPGHYQLYDIERTDGQYRPPFNDPLFDESLRFDKSNIYGSSQKYSPAPAGR